ncbi:MAG: guanylate kinase [Lachnospiraceae bacterium]|nr:guanylate kinase [Lachnospiraceae bacterium]
MSNKIFCIIGKSSSGKDTIYQKLLGQEDLKLHRVIMYTTRPIRDREEDGREYHFTSVETFRQLQEEGKVIESRHYDTVYGRWYYYTVDDGRVDLTRGSYLVPGVLASYIAMRDYYGDGPDGRPIVVPIYVEVEDGLRLMRAIHREQGQTVPKYEEMCRRFLTDTADMSDEKLAAAGIERRFENNGALEDCIAQIRALILEETGAEHEGNLS